MTNLQIHKHLHGWLNGARYWPKFGRFRARESAGSGGIERGGHGESVLPITHGGGPPWWPEFDRDGGAGGLFRGE
jgi:hypothetical protein